MARWVNIVRQWLDAQKSAEYNLYKVIEELVSEGIIPRHVKNEQVLYLLVATQINKCMHEKLIYPMYGYTQRQRKNRYYLSWRAFDTDTYTRRFDRKIKMYTRKFESQTGVNIVYYERLKQR